MFMVRGRERHALLERMNLRVLWKETVRSIKGLIVFRVWFGLT